MSRVLQHLAKNGVQYDTAAIVAWGVTDAITAHAGGGQGSAVALTSQVNRVTTVATAGDSVVLPGQSFFPNKGGEGPQTQVGVEIVVINAGANALAVFPATGETINGQSANASVNVAAGGIATFWCPAAGSWQTGSTASMLVNNLTVAGLLLESTTGGITAHSGGTQAAATQLTTMVNRVATVAAQGDSVALPAAQLGLEVCVINAGANAMQVFGNNAAGDTINGIATATGISQGVGTVVWYTCSTAGNWDVTINSLQSTKPQALSSGSPAIPSHVGHTYVITKGSIMAATLAAPTAGTDDGIEIQLSSSTAFAHTLTATGLLQTGTASVNVATFAAQAGAGLTLMAFNGKWIVLASVGITFS